MAACSQRIERKDDSNHHYIQRNQRKFWIKSSIKVVGLGTLLYEVLSTILFQYLWQEPGKFTAPSLVHSPPFSPVTYKPLKPASITFEDDPHYPGVVTISPSYSSVSPPPPVYTTTTTPRPAPVYTSSTSQQQEYRSLSVTAPPNSYHKVKSKYLNKIMLVLDIRRLVNE